MKLQKLISTGLVLPNVVSNIQAFPLPALEDLTLSNYYPHFHDVSNSWFLNGLSETVKILLGAEQDPSVCSIIDTFESVFDSQEAKKVSFESWINDQTNIAFDGILSNIGGIGITNGEVAVGAVVASPSKKNPNYFYQWTRDSAITINSLVEYLQDHTSSDSENREKFINSKSSKQLIEIIESYILNSYHLQRVNNLSGTWKSLEGLGEPKFMADNTPFNENWGRPQRDGPGLRVITIGNYLKFVSDNNLTIQNPKLESFKFIFDQILKPDLKYIIQNWNRNGFDLWEEVDSVHLFTSLTMLKALKVGIQNAERIHPKDTDFINLLKKTFTELRMFILVDSGFKIPDIPYLIETPSLVYKAQRSGLDIASILASLRAHDMDDADDLVDIPFAVDDSAVLSTLAALVSDMKLRYPINHHNSLENGFALGRYPEDLYNGLGIGEGNPWFISTATAAELMFKLVYYLYYHNKDLIITKDHSLFFQTFLNLNAGAITRCDTIVLPFGSESFVKATLSLMKYADSFLQVIQDHVDEFGHMSEQFNKYTGYMEGAPNLTWSYSSVWSAIRWRRKAENVLG